MNKKKYVKEQIDKELRDCEECVRNTHPLLRHYDEDFEEKLELAVSALEVQCNDPYFRYKRFEDMPETLKASFWPIVEANRQKWAKQQIPPGVDKIGMMSAYVGAMEQCLDLMGITPFYYSKY